MGGPEGPNEDVCERAAGTEANVEDEDVDFVGGVEEIAVSGYESEGFTLSEILLRKRLSKRRVSESVVDTSHLPQCEFSNIQHLPITFLLEVLLWPVIEFRLFILSALEHEDYFVRLLCLSE